MMAKVKFISFVPWVTIGSIIGSLFIVPLMPKIVDALYYKDKYNNDALKFYKKYIEDSICVKVVIPDFDSKLFLHNGDYDKEYMDSFYRENVIRYLKYKMPKSEFKRRFKNNK